MPHTPGPWAVHGDNKTLIGCGDRKMMLAEAFHEHIVTEWARTLETAQANARLIAAAPDLLEALQGLYEHCAMVHHTWGDGCNQKEADAAIALGRAAIAKATTDGQ